MKNLKIQFSPGQVTVKVPNMIKSDDAMFYIFMIFTFKKFSQLKDVVSFTDPYDKNQTKRGLYSRVRFVLGLVSHATAKRCLVNQQIWAGCWNVREWKREDTNQLTHKDHCPMHCTTPLYQYPKRDDAAKQSKSIETYMKPALFCGLRSSV